MNGPLNRSVVNTWPATAVWFLLVPFVVAAPFVCMPKPLPHGDHAVVGSVVGAVAMFAGLMLVQRLGGATVNGALSRRTLSPTPPSTISRRSASRSMRSIRTGYSVPR